MAGDTHARFEVSTSGRALVREVEQMLHALDDAHNGLVAVDTVLRMAIRISDEYQRPLGLTLIEAAPPSSFRTARPPRSVNDLEAAARSIPRRDRLRLYSTQIDSPGFWVFAGKAPGVGGIVGYLEYRNRRRREREWQEDAERRQAEATLRLTEAQADREKEEANRARAEAQRFEVERLAHELELLPRLAPELASDLVDRGITAEELARFEAFVEQRLEPLDRFVDNGLLGEPELLPPPDDRPLAP